jgi:hypothetical protein
MERNDSILHLYDATYSDVTADLCFRPLNDLIFEVRFCGRAICWAIGTPTIANGPVPYLFATVTVFVTVFVAGLAPRRYRGNLPTPLSESGLAKNDRQNIQVLRQRHTFR